MKHTLVFLAGCCLSTVFAQESPLDPRSTGHSAFPTAQIVAQFSFRGDAGMRSAEDSSYLFYREGYNLILEDQWASAREKFAALIRRFPTSVYVDDAQYWSAYALMHINREKALEMYRQFLATYRSSPYYPDAVADLNQLQINIGLAARKAPYVAVIRPDGSEATYTIAVAPRVMSVERLIRATQRNTPHIVREETIEPEIRLRIQVLSALGRGKQDRQSFETLKEVALDRSQPKVLRLVAVNSIAESRDQEAVPVLLRIAREDTNADIQNTAIDFIGYAARNKERSVEALKELFESLPRSRPDQLETTLYAIAEVGSDRAVDFLAKVASSHADYNLRSDAVFYLGSIGSERARRALLDVYRSK